MMVVTFTHKHICGYTLHIFNFICRSIGSACVWVCFVVGDFFCWISWQRIVFYDHFCYCLIPILMLLLLLVLWRWRRLLLLLQLSISLSFNSSIQLSHSVKVNFGIFDWPSKILLRRTCESVCVCEWTMSRWIHSYVLRVFRFVIFSLLLLRRCCRCRHQHHRHLLLLLTTFSVFFPSRTSAMRVLLLLLLLVCFDLILCFSHYALCIVAATLSYLKINLLTKTTIRLCIIIWIINVCANVINVRAKWRQAQVAA